jgi:hypothetical protein
MGEAKELSQRDCMQTATWGIRGLIGIGIGEPAGLKTPGNFHDRWHYAS